METESATLEYPNNLKLGEVKDDDTVSITSHSSHDDSFIIDGELSSGRLLNDSSHKSMGDSTDDESKEPADEISMLEEQIRQAREELEQLRSKGQHLRQTIYPQELKTWKLAHFSAAESLRQKLIRKPPHLLYTSALKQLYAEEGTIVPPPYIMNTQLQWMQTMHYTFHVNACQIELMQAAKDKIIAYLEEERRNAIVESDRAQEEVRKEVSLVADQLRQLLAQVEPYEKKKATACYVDDENEKSLSSINKDWTVATSANTSLVGFDFSNRSEDDDILPHGGGDGNDSTLQSSWKFFTDLAEKGQQARDSLAQFFEEANPDKLAARGQRTHEEFVTKLSKGNAAAAAAEKKNPHKFLWKKPGHRSIVKV